MYHSLSHASFPATAPLLLVLILLVLIIIPFSSSHGQVSAMSILSNTSLERGIDHIECSCTDENGFIFFGAWTAPASVSKVNQSNLQKLGTLYLNQGEDYASAIVYDFNGYIYVATYSTPTAFVVKVQTSTMNRIGHVALPSRDIHAAPDSSTIAGQLHKISAATFIPTSSSNGGGLLLFATDTQPSRIIRIPLNDFRFNAETVVTLQNREDTAVTLVPSTNYILVGLQVKPAQIVKLDTATLTRQGSLTLNSGEDYITTGFTMNSGATSSSLVNGGEDRLYKPTSDLSNDDIFYFLLYDSPGKIAKVQATSSAVIRLNVITIGSQESYPRTAVPLPWMNMIIIGCGTWPGIVVAVDVSGATPIRLWAKWVPSSDRYFSTAQMVTPFYRKMSSSTSTSTATTTSTLASSTTSTFTSTSTATSTSTSMSSTSTSAPAPSPSSTTTPTTTTAAPPDYNEDSPYTLKLILATDSGAASAVQFLPNVVDYSTKNFVHFNGGESLVSIARKHGDHIVLCSDLRPAICTKVDADNLKTLATLRLPLGDDWIRAFQIDKWGYGHVGCCSNIGRLITFSTLLMSGKIGTQVGLDEKTESCFHTAVFAPTLETASEQFLYVSAYYGGSMIKFRVTSGGSVSRVGVTTTSFPERVFTGGSVSPISGAFSIYGTFESPTARVVKFDLTAGTVSQTMFLRSGEATIRDAVIRGTYGYFAISPSATSPGIVKVSVGSTASDSMSRISKFSFGFTESFYAIVPLGGSSTSDPRYNQALLGTATEKIVLVDLSTGLRLDTLSTGGVPGVLECGVSASQDLSPSTASASTKLANLAWVVSYSSPSWVLKIDSTPQPQSNAAAAPAVPLEIVAGGVGGGIAFLLLIVIVLLLRRNNNNKNRYNNDDDDNDQPMLQVPRTNVTIVHSAMSVPSRDDMYSDRVAVPPPS